MTSSVKVTCQEDNLKETDMDSIGALPGITVQAQAKKTDQAGDCFFLNFKMISL